MNTIYAIMEFMDTLDCIRIFIRLSEKHSFSGVAQELGLTQPTISKAISALESDLGVQLLRRSSRGISLTAEGALLLKLGSPALDQLESALASVKDERLRLRGQLKISSSLGFTRLILVPLLDEFSGMHPELRLNFELSDGYVNLIEQGIDLAIRHGELQDSSLRAVRVGTWRRAVYASAKYIETHGQPQTIEDLNDHRLLYYNLVSDRPTWLFNDLDGGRKPFYFQPYLQSDGADLIREATIDGLGVTFAPTWMMSQSEKNGELVRMLEEYCTATHPTYILMSGTQPMSAKQKAITDFLKMKFATIPELNVGT